MQGFSSETKNDLIKWAFESGGTERGAHITRFQMYEALRGKLQDQDGSDKTALAISRSTPLGKDILGVSMAAYTEANFPEVTMLKLPFAGNSFDFCFSDQVLEHVEGDPCEAFSESVRVVRTGGYVCHTTCFINGVHGYPSDFWRFTPAALSLMAEKSGCEIVVSEGWGNREAWALVDAGFRFEPIPRDPKNPLHKIATRNDPEWPIVVWIIARKINDSASRGRIDALENALMEAKARLSDFQASTSWRITSPLRSLKRLFSRKR